MVLRNPSGTFNFSGATLNSPEVVTLSNPTPGIWTVLVVGFEINAGSDKFELRVALDGKVVK